MTAVKIILASGAKPPVYQTNGAAGADLCAHIAEPVRIEGGCSVVVPTGVSIALPACYEAQVRPRSGLAAKHGVTVLNAPGTIDADYRGDIGVILHNTARAAFLVKPGDRIAQLVIAPIVRVDFEQVESLPSTDRGHGGFGSTGK